MATHDEAEQALTDAIKVTADKVVDASKQGGAGVTAYSAAALRLAEARAWLISPGQPHGSSSTE